MGSELTPGVLVDDLVGVVDDIRGEIHGEFGTRPYRVFLMRRTWTGGERGIGDHTDSEIEILPPPQVKPAIDRRLRPAGPEEEGDVVLTEVSLAYSESDLYPTQSSPAEEFAYRIDEGHGHGARSRFFVPKGAPRVRRGDGKKDQIDWVVELRQTEDLPR